MEIVLNWLDIVVKAIEAVLVFLFFAAVNLCCGAMMLGLIAMPFVALYVRLRKEI